MIIFDLDGTLADCEHRRHFVDSCKNPNVIHGILPNARVGGVMIMRDYYKDTGELWKPDYKSFNEACDKDTAILPVILILNKIARNQEVQIWSGRCESVREKTESWLEFNCFPFRVSSSNLKMRPIGDNTPDDQLKEKWLDDTYEVSKWGMRSSIEFVFDDRPKVVRMWRRRGIFVFDCNQTGKEF